MTNPIFDGIGPQGIYYIVLAAARAAGIPEVHPHDLRRTSARLAHQGGADMSQIQQSLGHSSVKTTELYISAQQEIRPGKAAFDQIKFDEEESVWTVTE